MFISGFCDVHVNFSLAFLPLMQMQQSCKISECCYRRGFNKKKESAIKPLSCDVGLSIILAVGVCGAGCCVDITS